jgi:Terminase small subunit
MAGPLPNRKWEIFAREYASGESLSVAYIRAGYLDSRNARFNASRLSHKRTVRERIQELKDQFAEASGIKKEYLQHALLPTIRANPQDLFVDGTDKLKSIGDLPREVAAAIKTIKFDKKTGNIVEVSLADKVSAVGVLLRSIGGLIDNVQMSNSENMTDEQAYIAALESAVKLLGVLGLPPDAMKPLNEMIEQARAEGFEDFRTETDDRSRVSAPPYHGKPPLRGLNGDADRGR